MKKFLPLAMLALLLTACEVDVPPVKSGFVAKTWVPADSPDKTELSWSQLKQLAEWLSAHQTGWKYKITDTPPGTILGLRHSKGKMTWVNLRETEIWVGGRFRKLTPEERAEIQAILDPSS